MSNIKSINIRLKDKDIEYILNCDNAGIMIALKKPIYNTALTKNEIIFLAKAIGIKPEDLT